MAKVIPIQASTHAKKYPPSSLKAIRLCNGYRPSEGSSSYANEGTAAHQLAQDCLERGIEAYDLIGTVYDVDDELIEVTLDMARHIQTGYVDPVLAMAAGHRLMVEQKLPLAGVTGEDSEGTADAVILKDRAITIVDLKYGMGVKIDAQDNDQLMAYALAAIHAYEAATGPVDHVDLVIMQPRLNHVSEWRASRFDLEAFGVRLSIMIDKIEHGLVRKEPGEVQCKWCANAPSCDALSASVFEACDLDFEDLTGESEPKMMDNFELAKKLSAIGMIKTWIGAVEEESRKRLLSGQQVPGFKVVEGRKGARKWVDAAEVEELMRQMRLKRDAMFKTSLVSPTDVEKLYKAKKLGPTQWRKLADMMSQAPGAPTIAPESDPRNALVTDPAADFAAHL